MEENTRSEQSADASQSPGGFNDEADESRPAPADNAPLSWEQIEDLKKHAARADETWDRFLRQTADFDNFKKRAAREKQDAVKYGNESLLQSLIPIVDNFDMALAAVSAASGDTRGANQSLQTGINMIFTQLKSTLAEAGLEEIDATGKKFDPNFHEAVSEKESAEVPEGNVLQQLRKGYKLKDRLIRPATVVVAKRPGA